MDLGATQSELEPSGWEQGFGTKHEPVIFTTRGSSRCQKHPKTIPRVARRPRIMNNNMGGTPRGWNSGNFAYDSHNRLQYDGASAWERKTKIPLAMYPYIHLCACCSVVHTSTCHNLVTYITFTGSPDQPRLFAQCVCGTPSHSRSQSTQSPTRFKATLLAHRDPSGFLLK